MSEGDESDVDALLTHHAMQSSGLSTSGPQLAPAWCDEVWWRTLSEDLRKGLLDLEAAVGEPEFMPELDI